MALVEETKMTIVCRWIVFYLSLIFEIIWPFLLAALIFWFLWSFCYFGKEIIRIRKQGPFEFPTHKINIDTNEKHYNKKSILSDFLRQNKDYCLIEIEKAKKNIDDWLSESNEFIEKSDENKRAKLRKNLSYTNTNGIEIIFNIGIKRNVTEKNNEGEKETEHFETLKEIKMSFQELEERLNKI